MVIVPETVPLKPLKSIIFIDDSFCKHCLNRPKASFTADSWYVHAATAVVQLCVCSHSTNLADAGPLRSCIFSQDTLNT